MFLYRAFPWLSSARPGEPGHPLYVPSPQGAGRADNPEHYLSLYLSSAAAGAVAEAFGNFPSWTSNIFVRPELPGLVRALGTYQLSEDARICDLDDAATLLRLSLKPSDVVTRQKQITQRWALRIFQERQWIGVRCWSYYDPRWYSNAIWDATSISAERVEPLTLDHPAVVEAADILARLRIRDSKQ